MGDLQAGLGGTAKQFYWRHHRFVVALVLSAGGLATGTAAAFAVMQSARFEAAGAAAAGAALALCVFYSITRHWTLAALAALTPLPGLIWAAPLSGGADYGLTPVLGYVISFMAGVLHIENKLSRLLRAGPGAAPWLPPLLITLTVTAVLAALWFFHGPAAAGWQAVADTAAGFCSVALFQPLGLSLLTFDEAFIVRANRARERRARLFEWLGALSEPRWGYSFLGVALVIAVLSWFGAPHLSRHDFAFGALSLAIIAVAAGVAGKGWREGAGVLLAACTLWLLWHWTGAKMPVAWNGVELQAGAVFLLLSLTLLWRVRSFRLRGEAAEAARRRVLEEAGGMAAAVLGGLLAIVPALVLWPGHWAAAFALLTAGLSASLMCPALVTAMEALVPRRRTLKELYGRPLPPVRVSKP